MIKKTSSLISSRVAFILSAPALIWQSLFLYLPLLGILAKSFLHKGSPTLIHYKSILTPVYLKAIVVSLFIASVTTLLCLLIAYPIAHFISFKTTRFKTLLLFLFIVPSWMNLIIQIYAWFFLLQKNGLLSTIFFKCGLTSQPLHLLNSSFAILIGTIYCFLPFMLLPIYAAFEQIDRKLLEASADLGATRYETLKRIIFPLSWQGICNGILFVFVPVFGEYAIVELLGGSKIGLWGGIIVNKYIRNIDYAEGSALTIVGIIALALFYGLFYFTIQMYRKSLNFLKKLEIKI